MATNNNNTEYTEYQVRVYKNRTVWYLNGKYHREDGPAIEYKNGDKAWWLNGNRHREDGPAIEWADGDKEWYLNGIEYSESDWKKEVAKLRANKTSCDGRIVEIDGKKYKLIEEK